MVNGGTPMIIEKNDEMLLEEEDGLIYLTVYQKGCSFLQIHSIMVQNPQLDLDLKSINDVITAASGSKVRVGRKKPIIEWGITSDKMSASIKLNCTNQYLQQHYSEIVSDIFNHLNQEKITEGILIHVIQNELVVNESIMIAKGQEPVPGSDAVITYYKRSERKPAIRDNGKADYYDMNFLDQVEKGDWLGEKIPPTSSIPGRTITGEYVIIPNGKNKKLLYDPKTVGAFKEDGKIVLRALINGVVEFHSGKVTVGNHSIIEGDVGVETGNINFDGNVTIKGTVLDGFSVIATKDISILGELGVGNVEMIESKLGDVFIKGGIFGKGKSKIAAGRNIYVKHANECCLEAGGNIHIGYYSLGSTLKGQNIITDERYGKLIGGVIEARGKVRAGIIGNQMERKTFIHVEGFNRNQLKEELNEILIHYKTKIQELENIKERLNVYDTFMDELNAVQNKQYEQTTLEFEKITEDIFKFDQKRKILMGILESKGDGEITIGQVAYPDTNLQIKSMRKKLVESTKGTFFVQDNNMYFEK